MLIPDYVRDRIIRPMPNDSYIVDGSTPVVSFGDASRSRIATLELNPSRREFKPVMRLAAFGSSPEEVLAASNAYFSGQPYRQ